MDKLGLEQEVGVEVYKSKTPGIGGEIKEKPEDFVVEEITPEGVVLGIDEETGGAGGCGGRGEYVHLTLQKKNWDTLRAIKEVSKRLGVSRKRISFAGTKDKRAQTTQRVSVWNTSIEDLERVSLGDIRLRDFCYADGRINLGDLRGNRFTIVIRDIGLPGEEIRARMDEINNELRAGFPNFFGLQRFGIKRPNTHLVGKEIIKGNLRNAVMIYLAKDYPGEEKKTREARISLRESGDYREAIKAFPRYLGYEHALLNHLIKNEGDYRGALKQLPDGLSRMFIHAYQSFIFNRALSFYISGDIPVDRLPLVGYKTEADEVSADILEREGVLKQEFFIKEIPGLSSGGGIRDCFAIHTGFHIIDISPDDLNKGKNIIRIGFSLSKGCYATSLLREFIKA